MNIIPISSMSVLTPSARGTGMSEAANNLPFKGILQQAIRDAEETQIVKEQDSHALALGETDDIAGIMINSEKAEIAIQMLVQLRNKVMDAYTEIMRMNV